MVLLYSEADLTGPNSLFEPKCVYCTVIHWRIQCVVLLTFYSPILQKITKNIHVKTLNFTFVSYIYFSPQKFCRLAGFSCRGIAAGLNFTFVSYIYFSPQKFCRQAGFSCRGIAAGLWLSGRRRRTVSSPYTGIQNFQTNDDIRHSHCIFRALNA
jgi:hypothetical protein